MGQAASRPQTLESNRLGVHPYASKLSPRSSRSNYSLHHHSNQFEDHLETPSQAKEQELFSVTPLHHQGHGQEQSGYPSEISNSASPIRRSRLCNRRRPGLVPENPQLRSDLRQSVDILSSQSSHGGFNGVIPIILDPDTPIEQIPMSSRVDPIESGEWSGLVAYGPRHLQILRELDITTPNSAPQRRNDKRNQIQSWIEATSSPEVETPYKPWETTTSESAWSDDERPLHNSLPIVGIPQLTKLEYVAARKHASLERYPSMKRRNSQRNTKLGARQHLRAKSHAGDSRNAASLDWQSSERNSQQSTDIGQSHPALGTKSHYLGTSVGTSTESDTRTMSANGWFDTPSRLEPHQELLERVEASDNELRRDFIHTATYLQLIRRNTTKRRRSTGTVAAATKKTGKSTRTCEVCCDELPRTKFKRPTKKCTHTRKTCRGCLDSWIGSSIESNGWEKVKCPDCPEILSHADVKKCASESVFERYDVLATREALNAIPNFRWCLSPSCNSGQIHDSGSDGPLFTCTACYFQACAVHDCVWHSGETCSQYDEHLNGSKRRKAEEVASVLKIDETTKKCPGKNCGWKIEKNHGCDHMTCLKCKYEFCWLCFGDYKQIRKEGNSAHKQSCKYHSSRIKASFLCLAYVTLGIIIIFFSLFYEWVRFRVMFHDMNDEDNG